jgi:hypothetical protein
MDLMNAFGSDDDDNSLPPAFLRFTRCSALVRLLPDNDDVYIAQVGLWLSGPVSDGRRRPGTSCLPCFGCTSTTICR